MSVDLISKDSDLPTDSPCPPGLSHTWQTIQLSSDSSQHFPKTQLRMLFFLTCKHADRSHLFICILFFDCTARLVGSSPTRDQTCNFSSESTKLSSESIRPPGNFWGCCFLRGRNSLSIPLNLFNSILAYVKSPKKEFTWTVLSLSWITSYKVRGF